MSDQCRVGESMADDYFQHAAECPECSAYEAARVETLRAAARAETWADEVRLLREAADPLRSSEVTCRVLTFVADQLQERIGQSAPAAEPGQCQSCGERNGTHGDWCRA